MKEYTKAGVKKVKLPTELTTDNFPKCRICGGIMNRWLDYKTQLYKDVCQNCNYTRYENAEDTYLAAQFSKASEI